ncbi:MAG: 2Fe-2S iron-sulfur cluster-binding protein, partial [bacterium]|nr:2Fe-2S iron-sulfur cluster-binding protein [bacterium]
MHTLTIIPEQLVIQAPARARLHEVLDQHGIAVTAYCDGMGTCGKCIVRVTCAGGGVAPVSDADRQHLHEDELAHGLRLACQWRVVCDATIEIPARSRMEHMQVQGKGDEQGPRALRPAAAGTRQYGMAIDLGSTTVVGSLLDLESGQVLAVASGLNRQRRFGADVISRINHALQAGGL